MYMNNLLQILFFVLAPSFCIVFSQRCGDNEFFRPNSTYNINRNLVLSSLASTVSSRDGFYNVSVGEDPEKIYVLGMCIPGTAPQVCSACIQSASTDLLKNCPNQTNSFNWRAGKTLCFVRYSNLSFFNSIDLEPHQAEYNTGDVTGNFTEFNIIWEEFMDRMIISASSSTSGYYLADLTAWTKFQSIYALMQCIPGISSRDCDACLRESVRRYENCCGGKQGGSIRRPVCFYRWDLFPYLGAFDNITLKPPQSPKTMPPPSDLPNEQDERKIPTRMIVAIVVGVAFILVLLALGFVFCKKRKSFKQMKLETDDTSPQPLQYDLKTLEIATDKFSVKNKLGQGGFGVVYKGTFPNGTESAVKRLSRTSGQGLQEFKNEVLVVAKLQHNNLVKLLGFCWEGEEKMLVYEFLPNKSLDCFLFDTMNQRQLDWTKRYNIIEGIARGILYLHRDSRLKIIHRDLKASNILLDSNMNAKIADFGMAKIFAMEQTRDETNKIAGTYGYMAPEYLMYGQFSMESDVYSFGVLVLEIISGTTSSSFYHTDGTACNLVTYAWRLWRKGSALELVDPTFSGDYPSEIVTRCIQIALLCVQENPADRPSLSSIISMLTTCRITLAVPHEPGFFIQSKS